MTLQSGSRPRRAVLLIIALIIVFIVLSSGVLAASKQVSVFVSVLPQKFFVERIGGDYVNVEVMVGPGESPHTYDPTPRQMVALSSADLYFRVGVGFENIWMDKLAAVNRQMKIVDMRRGVPLRKVEGHSHGEPESVHTHDHDHEYDPHIWLSPKLARTQAETISQALSSIDPQRAALYASNLAQLMRELDEVDAWIRQTLAGINSRKFMVFHPSWGYFADEYDLVQVPIETAGREPSARELAQFIELARRERIKVIFVQAQVNAKSAQAVARAVGAGVVALDPLAEDYLSNLKRTAVSLRDQLLK